MKTKAGGSKSAKADLYGDASFALEGMSAASRRGDSEAFERCYAMAERELPGDMPNKLPAIRQAFRKGNSSKVERAVSGLIQELLVLEMAQRRNSGGKSVKERTRTEPDGVEVIEGPRVNVDTNRYMAAHGKKPRGYGHWMFNIEGGIYEANGTYTEALKEAVRKFRATGAKPPVVNVEVLS